jgi:hypothetical protein
MERPKWNDGVAAPKVNLHEEISLHDICYKRCALNQYIHSHSENRHGDSGLNFEPYFYFQARIILTVLYLVYG